VTRFARWFFKNKNKTLVFDIGYKLEEIEGGYSPKCSNIDLQQNIIPFNFVKE